MEVYNMKTAGRKNKSRFKYISSFADCRSFITGGISLILVSCGGNALPPSGSGFIEATEVIISAETGGQLKALYFDEGDKISTGDTIGLIDTLTPSLRLNEMTAGYRAAETRVLAAQIGIEQAEHNYNLAGKDYERASELIKTGSINQQLYDQIETSYKQSLLAKKQASANLSAARAELEKISAGLELLKKQINDCFPRATLSGTIVNKYIEAGELIAVGRQLIKIASLDTVWVKIYLPASDLSRVKLGDSAIIDPEDGRENPINGKICWISDAAEFTPKNVQTKESRADLVYAVKVLIPNPDGRLKIGMPVSVELK
jgi:HlyD family secretion protein